MQRILIADANHKNSELIGQLLSQTGYETITADTGNQILARVSLFAPELVILDTHFPDISGFEVCRRIRSNPLSKYTLILFISSLETKDSKIKAFQAGADDIIEKTLDSMVLVAKVSSLLRISILRNELEEKYVELEETNRMLEFQLKMSRRIQRSIMRDYDMDFCGMRLQSHYLPALDIGGDFYDLIQLDDSNLGLCIGDVSGHGISAALLTTMLSTMIKHFADNYLLPDVLLKNINDRFCHIFDGTDIEIYATLFCAVFDTENQTVYYSNAGQPYPFYLNARETKVTELDTTGTPIGLMHETVYELRELKYEKGDMFVFYTDGLCDMLYKDAPDQFQQRMKDLLMDLQAFPALSSIKHAIVNEFYSVDTDSAVKKFVIDDVSLIIGRFDGQSIA